MSHSVPKIDSADRAEIRTRAGLAAEVVAPYWPIRTFISRNPLSGFQHLRFAEGVKAAGSWIGGRGYAPFAAYKDWYRDGRIGDADLDAALHEHLAVAADTLTLSDGRALDAVAVLRRLLLLADEEMTAVALAAELDESGRPWRLDRGLTSRQRERLLRDARSEATAAAALRQALQEAWAHQAPLEQHKADAPEVGDGPVGQDLGLGATGTLADWCDQILGTSIRAALGERLIHWVAAFVDQGQAVWGMPKRERDLYQAWRYLGRWDLTPGASGARWHRAATQAPAQPEDAIIGALRWLGIPRRRWQEYLGCHIARQPGWAGLIRWRANHPDDYWQRRHPVSPTKYLAIVMQLEAEAVAAACRRCAGVGGTLPAIRAYFAERPEEYRVRARLARGGLPPDLERRARRAAFAMKLAKHVRSLAPWESLGRGLGRGNDQGRGDLSSSGAACLAP